jgi:hypothetical protein
MLTERVLMRAVMVFLFVSLLAGCGGGNALPSGGGAVWDLVIIGDSSMWELGNAFAAQIEEDAGVKVTVHDYANNAASAGEVLEVLHTGESMNARTAGLLDSIKDAEVVVMNLNLEDSIDPDNPVNLDGCFLMTKPGNCSPSSFEKYTEDLKEIWAEIFRIRGNKPIILRGTDLYNPLISSWKENGIYEECTTCWENLSDAARKAAEAYGIPFLARLDAFNGPNHDEDPAAKGYITEDGEHPSVLGAQFTAELLGEMGYDPVPPP